MNRQKKHEDKHSSFLKNGIQTFSSDKRTNGFKSEWKASIAKSRVRTQNFHCELTHFSCMTNQFLQIVQVFEEFCMNSSVHGIRYFVDRKGHLVER